MVNTQLLDYVKQQLAQGLTKETIERNLTNAGGWTIVDISEAFSAVGANQPASVLIAPSSVLVSNNSVLNNSTSTSVKYAGFWIRFVAINVDSIIIAIIYFVIQVPVTFICIISLLNSNNLAQLSNESVLSQIISIALSLIVTWGYFSLMTYYEGATLGKMLVGIQVKADNFEKLSFGRVLLRETVGKLVSQIILGIGYIIAGVTQKKQALHDMFAHSVVVYKDPSKKNTAGLIVGIIIAFIISLLLITIAIVGIFSSVVLVSLNSARSKATDARVHSVLAEMRTQAEVYYGSNNSYSTTRSCSSGMFADSGFTPIISQLKDKNILNCYAEASTYAISAPLSSTGTSTPNYCVDSTGFSGDAVAVDNGSRASCIPQQALTENVTQMASGQSIYLTPTVTSDGSLIAYTDTYSYTLPNGWKISQNGPQGMRALKQSYGYLLSISTTPIPSMYGNITSVDQVTTINQLKSSFMKKYPNAIIVSVNTGTLGGKKAYIMNDDISASDLTGIQNQGQSKQMSVTKYTTVYNGNAYTLAFISALSDEVTAQNDLQSIINSFKFN